MDDTDKVLELPEHDTVGRKLSSLAVGLYRGNGRASELVNFINKQASSNAQKRVQQARQRAKSA
jgi:hypothetical protein